MKKFTLTLFDEGGAAGGEAGAGSESNGAVVEALDDAKHRSKSNPLADVRYGIQADSQDDNDNSSNEGKISFEDLIAGDYKDDFEKKVQNIMNKRLKNVNGKLSAAQTELQSLAPLLDSMKRKYGDLSPEELCRAYLNDDSVLESEAMDKGMDVATLKHMKELEYKALQYEQRLQEDAQEARMRQQFEQLEKEAEEIKKIYPNFSLENELENDELVRLISNNIPLRTAFEVIHRDEIQPALMQYVAKTAEEKVARAVASNSRRPSENGLGKTSPANVKTDPSKFTKEDREEIRRRVRQGERIVL